MKTKPRIKKSVEVKGTFVRIPEELKKRAKIHAVNKSVTMNQLIIDAINEKIEREK